MILAMNYYVARDEHGVLAVARVSPPSLMQVIGPDGWVDRPSLITSLQDAGTYEEVTEGAARAAATSLDLSWPRSPVPATA